MLVLVVFSISYYLIGFTGCEATAQQEINSLEGSWTPQDFSDDYIIDLKPDGYLVVDTYDGECYYVPFGELEDWFMEMNM